MLVAEYVYGHVCATYHIHDALTMQVWTEALLLFACNRVIGEHKGPHMSLPLQITLPVLINKAKPTLVIKHVRERQNRRACGVRHLGG